MLMSINFFIFLGYAAVADVWARAQVTFLWHSIVAGITW